MTTLHHNHRPAALMRRLRAALAESVREALLRTVIAAVALTLGVAAAPIVVAATGWLGML